MSNKKRKPKIVFPKSVLLQIQELEQMYKTSMTHVIFFFINLIKSYLISYQENRKNMIC